MVSPTVTGDIGTCGLFFGYGVVIDSFQGDGADNGWPTFGKWDWFPDVRQVCGWQVDVVGGQLVDVSKLVPAWTAQEVSDEVGPALKVPDVIGPICHL